jgi:hypothetical protein
MSERDLRPDEDDWDPPEGDEVTEPEELAEAEPGMEQSPLRTEEQPPDDE